MPSIIGTKLQTALTDLQRSIDELRHRREDVIAAWEEHDYDWLVSTGFLTQADVDGEVA